MIVGGLSWWQSWLCVWFGYLIAACFICLTGRIGSMYHISFPVVSRASFGIWGSLWPVFNRAAMACIWYGVQAWIGGTYLARISTILWRQILTLFKRGMRYNHDSGNLVRLPRSAQQLTSQLWDQYQRLSQLLPLLAM